MALGRPGINQLRQLELRQLQDILDSVRQRLGSLDAEVTRLGSTIDATNLAQQVTSLTRALQQLTIRVSSLESALGLTDTFVLAAGEAIAALDCVVPMGVGTCGQADPNDPTHIHALLGVAQAAAGVGQSVTIQRRGSISVPGAAFVTGRPCYVGLDSQITQVSGFSAYAVPIGVATSATTVWISPALAILNQVDVYSSTYDSQLPVTYDYLNSQIGALETLLTLTDGFVYLYQGTLVTTTAPGGGAVDSVNGQTGTVVLALDDINDVSVTGATNGQFLQLLAGMWSAVDLYLDSLLDVITFGAAEGEIIVRRSGSWVNESNPGQFTAASTAPSNPQPGQRWVDLDTGICYTYFFDGTSSQWVEL